MDFARRACSLEQSPRQTRRPPLFEPAARMKRRSQRMPLTPLEPGKAARHVETTRSYSSFQLWPVSEATFLRYRTASVPKGGVNAAVEPPRTVAPAVLVPVAGFIHSTVIVPFRPERFTVNSPAEGAYTRNSARLEFVSASACLVEDRSSREVIAARFMPS